MIAEISFNNNYDLRYLILSFYTYLFTYKALQKTNLINGHPWIDYVRLVHIVSDKDMKAPQALFKSI